MSAERIPEETIREEVAQFETQPRGVELCGRCGHQLQSHLAKACKNTLGGRPCPCPFGVRTDVFANQQLSELNNGLRTLIQVTLVIHGFEVNKDGDIVKASGLTDARGNRI